MDNRFTDIIRKPKLIPIFSMLFTFANIAVIYYIYKKIGFSSNFLWYSPIILLNIFFFWAENDTYKREKKNYIELKKELDIYIQPKKVKWKDQISSVSRSKVKNKKHEKSYPILEQETSGWTGPQTI